MDRNGAVIGLISDTHGLVRPEALRALEGSDLIVHAGDVGKPEILDALKLLAPVVAVRGNIDRGGWAEACPPHAAQPPGNGRAPGPNCARMDRPGCAGQSGDCHQFPPLELAGCTRFAHAELTSPYLAPFSSRRVRSPHNATDTNFRRTLPEFG